MLKHGVEALADVRVVSTLVLLARDNQAGQSQTHNHQSNLIRFHGISVFDFLSFESVTLRVS
jgi:hypothetical protein